MGYVGRAPRIRRLTLSFSQVTGSPMCSDGISHHFWIHFTFELFPFTDAKLQMPRLAPLSSESSDSLHSRHKRLKIEACRKVGTKNVLGFAGTIFSTYVQQEVQQQFKDNGAMKKLQKESPWPFPLGRRG